jgi:HAD superfamily hydrolase (TIGR01509 family)
MIIFDCDGVLVDSERIVTRVEAALLGRWGWQVSEAELRLLLKGCAFPEVKRRIEARTPAPLPADWAYELAMATAVAFRAELRAVPGVCEVVAALHARGVPMCVASQSAPSRVQLSLTLCGLDGFFGAHVFTASQVARPKPAPDLFLHAARTLAADPAACTVIEDSPSGVSAAVAAGMRVLGYAGDEDAAALRAAGAHTFTRMSELWSILSLA